MWILRAGCCRYHQEQLRRVDATDLQHIKGGVSNECGSDSGGWDITRSGLRLPAALLIPHTDRAQADQTAGSRLSADKVQSTIVRSHGVIGDSKLRAGERGRKAVTRQERGGSERKSQDVRGCVSRGTGGWTTSVVGQDKMSVTCVRTYSMRRRRTCLRRPSWHPVHSRYRSKPSRHPSS